MLFRQMGEGRRRGGKDVAGRGGGVLARPGGKEGGVDADVLVWAVGAWIGTCARGDARCGVVDVRWGVHSGGCRGGRLRGDERFGIDEARLGVGRTAGGWCGDGDVAGCERCGMSAGEAATGEENPTGDDGGPSARLGFGVLVELAVPILN